MVTLRQEALAAWRELGFRPRKRFGQNFLVHEGVLRTIVRLLDVREQDRIFEIGPGLGFLTRQLLELCCDVWAVEVDSNLVKWLRETLGQRHASLRLIEADVLTVDFHRVLPQGHIKVVGNLPYSIATQVLFRLFEQARRFSELVLMVQQEVGQRIMASPGTKAYGVLSVSCQIYGRVTERVSVAPEAFIPRPRVRSTILKILPYDEPLVAAEEITHFRRVVRAAFGQRRKMIGNALKEIIGDRSHIVEVLRSAGIGPERRGETLDVHEFLELSHALQQSGRR